MQDGDAGTGIIPLVFDHMAGPFMDTKEITFLEDPPLYFGSWAAPIDAPRGGLPSPL